MKSNQIKFVERELTDSELKSIKKGFDQYSKVFGNPPLDQKRYTITIMDDNKFVGCATGLTNYDNWFYLSDFFVDKKYRKQSLGSRALRKLENKIAKAGIKHIWTWTAEFEASEFYKKYDYKLFYEMKNYYPSGHSRIGLVKNITICKAK